MRFVALFIFISLAVGCSAYKSPGRKYLEQHATEYSNGVLSVRYSCAGTYPESGMKALGEVDDNVFAWTAGLLPDERWLLKSPQSTCRFSVTERQGDPLPSLLELFHSPRKLDEGP